MELCYRPIFLFTRTDWRDADITAGGFKIHLTVLMLLSLMLSFHNLFPVKSHGFRLKGALNVATSHSGVDQCVILAVQ